MEMTIDTTWSNQVTLSVETELDNAHEPTQAELSRRMVEMLSMMATEIRRENEAFTRFERRADDSAAVAPPPG